MGQGNSIAAAEGFAAACLGSHRATDPRRFLFALPGAFGGLAGLAGCGASFLFTPSPAVPASTVSPIPGSPIQHIVVIMQENRSFDNLFNGFPGADTVQSGMDGSTSVPLKPVSLGDSRDLEHSHMRWWQDWDNGAHGRFCARAVPSCPIPMFPRAKWSRTGRWQGSIVIGDRMFQSNTGPSFVAHQYMIAGQSANVAENPTGSIWGCDAAPGTTAAVLGPDGTELPGVYPCFDYQTIADLLDEKGVTWRYYAPASGDSFLHSLGLPGHPAHSLRQRLERQCDLAAEPGAHRYSAWRARAGNMDRSRLGALRPSGIGNRRAGLGGIHHQRHRQQSVLELDSHLHHMGRLGWMVRPCRAAPMDRRHGARVPRPAPCYFAVGKAWIHLASMQRGSGFITFIEHNFDLGTPGRARRGV